MKKTLAEVLAKYESGKLLSKGDCKVIIDEIYTRFLEKTAEYTSLFDILIDNAEKVIAKQGRPFSDHECKDYFGLSLCDNHSAKMAGMESVSTNNKINTFCNSKKCIEGSICAACFADRQIDVFTSMDKPLTINYLLLNYKVLPVSILPVINRLFFRIESFGDVASAIQAINYLHMMTANSVNRLCSFAAWSKNPAIWYAAFRMEGKPKNLSFGVSSLFINVISKVAEKILPYVDFIFTVFDSEEEAEKAGYRINCGARHCLSCLRCYKANKRRGKDPVLVIEEKK